MTTTRSRAQYVAAFRASRKSKLKSRATSAILLLRPQKAKSCTTKTRTVISPLPVFPLRNTERRVYVLSIGEWIANLQHNEGGGGFREARETGEGNEQGLKERRAVPSYGNEPLSFNAKNAFFALMQFSLRVLSTYRPLLPPPFAVS